MTIDILIISGTRCSGKSFISKHFISKYSRFQIAEAITTRNSRKENEDNHYSFVSLSEFDQLENDNALLTHVSYSKNKYGIRKSEIEKILKSGKVPVILIAPECIDQVKKYYENSLSIFIDADDQILEQRLKNRGQETNDGYNNQLQKDREFYDKYDYQIFNSEIDVDSIILLIYRLILHYNAGGILDYKLIQVFIACGLLIENHSVENIKGASYDISLGEEYYQNGELHTLDLMNGFIIMHPGDFAIVKSKETFNLPRDICGRFDLRVDMFFKGLILSNGPQIDPGFQGKLFCLLFNPSNDVIQLKYGDPFATIEFAKILKPTHYYKGKYQRKDSMHDYLNNMIDTSAIVFAFEEIRSLKKANIFERTLPMIVSILSVLAIIYGFIFGPLSSIDEKIDKSLEDKLNSNSPEVIIDSTSYSNSSIEK